MNVYLAEFIGTAVLVLLGNGVVANVVLNKTKGNNGGWIVITAGWGLAVAIAVYTVGRISGAHINPAVTIGLASLGEFPWPEVFGYVAAQIAGGTAGAALVWLTYLPHWKETEDQGDKLACHCTCPAIRNLPANLMAETLGSGMLVFGVLAIGNVATGLETTMSTVEETGAPAIQASLIAAYGSFFAPLLVGLLVFSIGLSLGGSTGYAINPARDLGPRIAHAILPIAGKGGNDWPYSWVPVLGPIVGGIAGAQLYYLLGF